MLNLRRVFAIVAAVVVAVPLLASAPLFDPDEGLHAAIAQEMVRSGDYVTPRFLGEPFLDKPILFFWAEAASLRLFGDTETAVRLPPLLFGLAGMLAVALLGRALFGEAAGLISGIVYGTMLLPFGVSQIAVHDIGLVPFMCVAAWCLARLAVADAPPSWSRVVRLGVLAGVCLGLSILTKGLAGVVFAGILGACLFVWRPAAFARLAIALTVAVIVAALVAAPWYVAMERAHPGYLHYYFVERHVQGYLTATQRHAGRPLWYYVPIVLGGALPWALHLAGALRSAAGERLRVVVWAWFVIGLVFLSSGESKLATYALPLFPALAIGIGEYVHGATARGGRGAMGLALWMHVALLGALPIAALVALQARYGQAPSLPWLPVIVFAVLALDAGRRASRASGQLDIIGWLTQASICSLIGIAIVVPRAAAWMTAKELAVLFNARGTLPPRVSVVDERIGSLVFYLAPALRGEATPDRVAAAPFADAILRARHDPDEAVIAVRNDRLPHFQRLFAQPPAADFTAGTFSVFRARTVRDALSRSPARTGPRE
jgi:4-amino-4-deoxy-L-arabinose transferase-like glycosyltransferase